MFEDNFCNDTIHPYIDVDISTTPDIYWDKVKMITHSDNNQYPRKFDITCCMIRVVLGELTDDL